jgi:nitronate monooxygenase
MLPRLIQGGMGVGVSGWVLAREVASLGQLGVVSGTALDTILIRRLGQGDPGGHVRRALAAFPVPQVASRILDKYFVPRGAKASLVLDEDDDDRSPRHRYKLASLPRANMAPERQWLFVVANFVEVFLTKEGHDGVVGINYLHKIQLPTLASLYGAILAGVNVVLMGAGIPGDIPPLLEVLRRHEPASLQLDVADAGDQKYFTHFDPRVMWETHGLSVPEAMAKPAFLAIVSSATLAKALIKKAPGGIDGFIVEAPTAGGHNAPPRGVQQLSVKGEPIYGVRDEVDLEQMRALGVPFWLAGGCASRARFEEALQQGAAGVQVGTAFAFCDESGLEPSLRKQFLGSLLDGKAEIFTDPAASPTNFPFKVASLAGSLSEQPVYEDRPRMCDLGYLRKVYRKGDGSLGYRCPGEPEVDFLRKGGAMDDTHGRKCLCNALTANIGLGQVRSDGYAEPPMLTAGDDLDCIRPYIDPSHLSYRARDVIAALVPATL